MYRIFKRVADFGLALAMLIFLSPLMVAAAILIKINRDGPVLFKQQRPGMNEKIFTVYKFRTMSVRTHDADGRELADFERMSKIGSFLRKTSVDELPQLINILKGDMSFIGPRPLLVEYLPLYNAQQKRRHEVRPGISGLAQVNGRNAISWEEKFRLDVEYVDSLSLKTDIHIFFKTITNVLKQDGINSAADNTMEKFTGTKEEVAQ
ncbi:MAG: sugar transferase [Clostridia bacterium]|nr:sugar transferase [Clostridia bacterium]